MSIRVLGTHQRPKTGRPVPGLPSGKARCLGRPSPVRQSRMLKTGRRPKTGRPIPGLPSGKARASVARPRSGKAIGHFRRLP